MNIWIINRNSMKYHYLKERMFTVTETLKILLMQITHTEK